MVCMCEESPFLAVLLGLLFSQLASVILKQYVETHWCAQSERFRPPETTERVRRGTRLVCLWRCAGRSLTTRSSQKAVE